MKTFFRNAALFCAGIASFTFTTLAAQAACTQADAAGTWQAYSYSNGSSWVACKVTVGSNGAIANSTCTNAGGTSGAFTNGKLTLVSGPSCLYRGSFKIGGQLNTIKSATMSRDKLIINGVGTMIDGIFVFNATRI
jgi:hypothetical protein